MRNLLPLCCCFLATLGHGHSSLRFEVRAEPGSPPAAAVMANGQLTVRMRHPKPAVAVQLADIVADRLRRLAEQGVGPDGFSVRGSGDGYTIAAAGIDLVTASPAAAQLARATPHSLAQSWLKFLKMAFSQPYLSVDAPSLTLPLSGRHRLQVRGHPDGQVVQAQFSDPAVATVTVTGSVVEVVGRSLGEAELILLRGEARLSLPVAVQRPAGRITEPITAVISGQRTPPEMARTAIIAELQQAIDLAPGASLRYALPNRIPVPAPGSNASIEVAVKLDGAGLLPQHTSVRVELRNQTWADHPADWLLVSNVPESVRTTQLLLRAPLADGRRSRLLYHHQTAAAVPLTYEVRLLNPTDRPARLWLRDASAGPTPYPERAGHLAAHRYWSQRLAEQGLLLTLPAQTSWTITGALCKPRDVLSGISEFLPLDAAGLEVQMVATTGPPVLGPRAIAGATTAAFHDEFRFAAPDQSSEYVYQPGGMYAFINVGRDPLRSVAGPPLLGNYGAVYRFEVEFRNTGRERERYELVFSADGGAAMGTVVIDGRIVDTPLVQAGRQERLLDLTLPPGGKRRYQVMILPESGSNYPLRLVGRPYTRGWSGRSRG